MNSIKSVELAKIARNHPDHSLCVALNVTHPYNNGTYKRRLVAADIVEIFADRDIQGSHTFSDHREATEFMFCLGETNSVYDVYPRIRELEATTLAFLYSFELEGMISECKLSEAKEVLNQRLPEVLENPALSPTHDSPFSEHAEFLSLCDLDIAVSVGIGDLNKDDEDLRIFGEKPHTVSVDTDAKIITLEFDVLDDNHEGLKRVNALEKQLEKLISTTAANKYSKPHATQVKMAHKLLANR